MENNAKPIYQKAPIWKRFVAELVDVCIIAPLALLVVVLISTHNLTAFILSKPFLYIIESIGATYSVIMVWQSGATIGKRLMKIKVVTAQYKRASFWSVILREIPGKYISTWPFMLGYLWPLVDKNRQAWHDKIARTLVVSVDSNRNLISIAKPEHVNKKVGVAIIVAYFIAPFLFFIVCTLYVVQPYEVRGQSMAPNYTAGQYYFGNKITYWLQDPARNDVVVFRNPENREVQNVKRVVGMPNDTIQLKEGIIYINGQPLSEPYLAPGTFTKAFSFMAEGDIKKVPTNQYFLLGDNRDISKDSREFGFVPKYDIVARIDWCYHKCQSR